MKKSVLILIMAGFWAVSAFAQSPWLSDARLSMISLEWDKPVFDDRTFDQKDVTDASSVLFLTGRARINDDLRFVAEVPFSYFGYKSNPAGDNNSTVIGNVYVGGIKDFNTSNPNNHAFIELGVRIPTTPDPRTQDRFGGISGLASERSDRVEAFMSDTWAVPLIGNFVSSVSGPFAVRARLGSIYDIFTDDLKNEDNSLWLLYGITGMYRKPTFEANAGFSGRNQYVGNPSGVDFWDSGATQVRAGVARPFRNVTPGIYARLPLGDNYTRVLDFAYGVSIEIRQ